jgi:SAM domain (Sterile alpha motif)
MDLAVWLRSLGLEQYETAFRENAITEKLLASLTAEDLTAPGRGEGGMDKRLCCGPIQASRARS